MNDNDLILAELRKISAWTEQMRKINKRAMVGLAIFLPIVILAGVIVSYAANTEIQQLSPPEKPGWYEVDKYVRNGEFADAIKTGEELIQKTPNSPYAHRRFAEAYLATGDVEKACQHYAELYRLFPSDENEKLLRAIEKRIESEAAASGKAANINSPVISR